MQVQQEFKEEVKYNFYKFIPYVIIVVLLFLLFKSCLDGALPSNSKDRLDSLKNAYDSVAIENENILNHAITLAAELTLVTHRLDSMKSIELKIVERWHKTKTNGRDSLVHHICDTVEVLKIYDSVVAKADSLHRFDSTLIRQHEIRELVLENTVANRDSLVKNRDTKLGLKDIELNIREEQFNRKLKKKNKTIFLELLANLAKDVGIAFLIFK